MSEYPHTPIAKCPIKIEERILHYLAGLAYLDKQLWGMNIKIIKHQAPFSESQLQVAKKILAVLSSKVKYNFDNDENDKNSAVLTDTKKKGFSDVTCIHLRGSDDFGKEIVAQWVCDKLGLDLWHINAEFIPSKSEEIEAFTALWCREALLLGSGLYISAQDVVDPAARRTIAKLIESGNLPGPLFVATEESWSLFESQQIVAFAISKPLKSEWLKIWQDCIKAEGLPASLIPSNKELAVLAGHYDFSTHKIISAIREALLSTNGEINPLNSTRHSVPPFSSSSSSSSFLLFASALWKAAREVAVNPKMEELAIKISPKAKLHDIVLASQPETIA